MQKRLKQIARELALPYGNRGMTFNSRLAQELGKWAEQMGKGEAFNNAVFRAYFADGYNIADINTLAEIAQAVGLSFDEACKVLKERACSDAVDADWKHASALRVTAVPTFLMDGQLLVGAQPYNVLANFMFQNNVNRRPADH